MNGRDHGAAPLAVTAQFVLSAVGLDAETTCAALRARISRVRECDLYSPMAPGPETVDNVPLTAAKVPDLEVDLSGMDRLLVLALGALRGLIDRARMARAELSRAGILLALPAPDAVTGTWNLERLFMPTLLARAGLVEVPQGQVAVALGGNAAVLSLLGTAATWLEAGAVDQCIVLAVDSYIDVDRLQALDQSYRLKSERGVDGFVPGEAAVALLVQRAVARTPMQRAALARLTVPVLANEPRPMTGDRPSSGVGLVAALRGALRSKPGPEPAGWILCDMNGESYRAFEWGLARVRLGAQLAGQIAMQHPADCLGDTGAACAGLLIACATQAYARNYAPQPVALVWTSSEVGARGALLVLPPST